MAEQTFKPTRKVAAGGAAGIISAAAISILGNRFHIDLSPEEASLLTFLVMSLTSYFTPNKTPQEGL